MEEKSKTPFKLSDRKLELLGNLLAEAGIGRGTLQTISRRKNLSAFPVSLNQQRLWLLSNLEDGIHYNDHFDLRLTGPLDVAVLERTIEEILNRHEAMRCVFSEVDGAPVQIVMPPAAVALPRVDLSSLPDSRRMAEATRLAIEEARTPFDLARGPLWRFALITIAQHDHLLLITAHHIAIDGWSRGVFLREFSALYAAFLEGRLSPLETPPLQYADYASWQADWVQTETVAKQLEYWERELARASAFLALPTDRPRPQLPSFRGARHWFTLSPATTAALKTLCQRERVSLFMVLVAVLQTLLHCYTGQEDFLIWTPVANRTRKELQGMIGYFLNMLALRGRFQDDTTFLELLVRARGMTLGALANQDVPFEKLIDVLRPDRSQRQPLFQVLFVLQNVPFANAEVSGISVRDFEIDSGTANFELAMSFTETTDGIRGRIEYATDLFDAAHIETLAAYFQVLIDIVCANPATRIAELPLLPVRNQALIEFVERTSLIDDRVATKPLSPRDMLEQHLVKVWENVLRIHPVSVNDNFFDIGGHSLMAVRLFSEIRTQTGCNLPLATLFQAPTIKQLAEALRKDGWTSHWSSLVPIQPAGSKPPFFCVHGGGGNVLLFRDLAKRLGSEYPFFGLQSQGLDGNGNFLGTVDEMAVHYLKQIRELQPQGPYYLGGFCMGGAVAYHMAQLLLEQGQETKLLAAFDTYNHNGAFPSVSVGTKLRRFREKTYFHWANMAHLSRQERIAYLKEKLREVKERNLSKWSARGAAFLEDINDHAGFSYQPKPYPGKLTLFQPQTNYHFLRKPYMGWNELALGGVEVIELPAHPGGIFIEPYVRVLADKLRACIDAADQPSDADSDEVQSSFVSRKSSMLGTDGL